MLAQALLPTWSQKAWMAQGVEFEKRMGRQKIRDFPQENLWLLYAEPLLQCYHCGVSFSGFFGYCMGNHSCHMGAFRRWPWSLSSSKLCRGPESCQSFGTKPSKTPLYTTSFSTQIDTGCFCFGHLSKDLTSDVRSRCPRLQKSQVLRLTRKVRERKGILALFYIANNSTNSLVSFAVKKVAMQCISKFMSYHLFHATKV